MGAAMTRLRCRARAQSGSQMQARPDVRDPCPRPLRARNRAPFSPLARVCAALPAAAVGTAVTRGLLEPEGVQAPGRFARAGQDLSLFFNTLKINRSGIILAFDRPLRRNSRCGPARWAARRGPGGGSSAPSWRWGRGRFSDGGSSSPCGECRSRRVATACTASAAAVDAHLSARPAGLSARTAAAPAGAPLRRVVARLRLFLRR